MKNVMILIGAGQIGMAIARRMGYGMKIVIGDKKMANAQALAEIMSAAGFDVVSVRWICPAGNLFGTSSLRHRITVILPC